MTEPLKGMDAIKSLMKEFDAVDDYLKAVHEILGGGHMPDIAGLDDRVSSLCTSVLEVDPSIQGRCLAKLDALMKKLDTCDSEMRAFHEAQQRASGKQ